MNDSPPTGNSRLSTTATCQQVIGQINAIGKTLSRLVSMLSTMGGSVDRNEKDIKTLFEETEAYSDTAETDSDDDPEEKQQRPQPGATQEEFPDSQPFDPFPSTDINFL